MSRRSRYRLVEDPDLPTTTLGRLVASFRSYTRAPLTLKSKELAELWSTGAASASGVAVSEASALNYSAVWAAVNLIASDVASLPLILYKRNPDGGKERYPTHPLYRLLHDRPNPETTSVVFRKVLHAHVLTWGNGYAEIERDNADRPRALWLLTPDRVTPFRAGANAPLQYRVSNPSGGELLIDQRNMLHVPGLGWDGTQGYSVIAKARGSIGLGVASENFGGKFFGNGATFGGVLSYQGPRPPEMAEENYRASFEARYKGIENSHKMLALYNGAKYERIGIPPNDAQFLETRQFQITEVARWFNLPPHKIGDLSRATFSNIEQQSIDYYTTTLMPWLTVWEQELSFKLIAALEQSLQFVEHIADGLLRGDAAGRGAAYTSQFNVGGITVNEVRAAENRNKIAGGDRAFVPLNMVPLDRIDEIIDADIAAKKQPKVAPAPAPPDPAEPDPEKARQLAQLVEERDRARQLAQLAEDAKDVAVVERVQARADAERVTGEATRLGLDLGAAVEALTAERARAVAAETLVEELRADRARLQGVAEDERQQRADAAVAVRAVLVDGLRWLIERESGRARAAQASPDKLRRWIAQFYPTHEELARKLLRPSVRAWLACEGYSESLNGALDRLVGALVGASVRELHAVADEHDAETLAPALETVLRRWENDRAETVADQLTREAA